MPTVEELASALSGMTQAQRRQLGERCGVPFDTLQKIALRQTRNPRISTYQRLATALRTKRR
jgi:transcriptional regulator with XRE-family HTH domain